MLFQHFHSFLILLLAIQTRTKASENCFLNQTVDLYDANLLPNGSYSYENTIIPPELIREYSSTTVSNNSSEPSVRTQKRACICAVKQCLRFCSKVLKNMYEDTEGSNTESDYTVNVFSFNNSIIEKHVIHDFYPIYGQICDNNKYYMLEPEEYGVDYEWTLYENTTLLRKFDQRYLSINEYCFDLHVYNKNGIEFMTINPNICSTTPSIPWYEAWAKAFSIPFLIATIIFYNSLTHRNEKNKCFQAYLFFVTLSYTLFCSYTISRIVLPLVPCFIFGFIYYYTIMSYLIWTCILSYDIWRSITRLIDNRPSFRTYCVVSITIPLLMTLTTFGAQISALPDELKPGISERLCALDILRWSAVIYDYIPRMVAFIFSLTLYVMIMMYKKKVEKDLLKKRLSNRKPEPLFDKFILFFRIFLFMGITWSLDILVYFLRMVRGKDESPIYMVIEFINALYGFVVFLTLICRPANLRQVRERFATRFNRAETTL